MATEADIRINRPLTNHSVGYSNNEFIAQKVLGRLAESRSEPFYYLWDEFDAFRLENDYRAPGTKANEVTFGLNKSDTFYLRERSLKTFIPIEDLKAAKDADAKWNIKKDQVNLLNHKMWTRYENEVSAAVFNGTTFTSYTTALTGNDQWSAYGTSDPIDDINTAKEDVRKRIGRKANIAVMGEEVFSKLSNHPDILDRIKGGATKATAADVTAQNLAVIFKLEEVIIGGSLYDAAVEQGRSNSTLTDNWGKSCMVCYRSKTPSKMSPSLGYTFYDPTRELVKEWFDQEREAHMIQVTKKFVSKITSARSGQLLTTVVA